MLKIWDAGLQKNEPIFREIITQAQGEKALEEYLKNVIFFRICFLFVSLGTRVLAINEFGCCQLPEQVLAYSRMGRCV